MRLLHDTIDVVKHVTSRPKLLLPILATSWFWLFAFIVVSGLPVFAKDVLLRQRAGGDDDAGAVCDWRRHRLDPRGEATARRGQRPLRPLVRGARWRSSRSTCIWRARACWRRQPTPISSTPPHSCPAGQLAHRPRSDRYRDGRWVVHRAALRDSPARERAEPPVARHRRQQHHQRAVHDRGNRRRRSRLSAPDHGRIVRAVSASRHCPWRCTPHGSFDARSPRA